MFLLNSSLCTDKQVSPAAFAGSVKHKYKWNNATIEEESIPGCTSGLLATKSSHSTAKFVASSFPNAQILLDRHGYVRPIQSFYRLCPPFYQLPDAFESISVSRLHIKKQEYIALLCVGKKKELMAAIEKDDIGLVQELTQHYIDRRVTQATNEVSAAVKRPKISSEVPKTRSGGILLSLEEASYFLEKSNGNRNILHACIKRIQPAIESKTHTKTEIFPYTQCTKAKSAQLDESTSYEEARWRNYSKQTDNNEPETSSKTILSYFLSLPALTRVTHHLLSERDISGRTPFMLALRNQDLVSASLILDYVENTSSLSQQSRLYESAISQTCYEDQLPLQTLLFSSALPYCEFGLKTMLLRPNTMLQLDQVSTRSMLAFIQGRYPSAYRCEAYERTQKDNSLVLSRPFLRSSVRDVDWRTDPDKNTPFNFTNDTPRFLVAFSDVREMRDAIEELQSTQLAGPVISQPTFSFVASTTQYCGQAIYHETWRTAVHESLTTHIAERREHELLRANLVKRLLELTSVQPGKEDVLSSILREQLLVEYLEDICHIGDKEYAFNFAKPSLNQNMPQQFGLGLGGLGGSMFQPIQTLQTPDDETATETEEIESVEDAPAEMESILHILTGSWPLIASALLTTGTQGDSDFSHIDAFMLSLIHESPSSVLSAMLRCILNRIEQTQSDVFIQVYTNSRAVHSPEEEDIQVTAVVKRFLQSLVRLYNRAIAFDRLSDNSANQNFNQSTIETQKTVYKVRDRIFCVLRCFKSLSVRELFSAAHALSLPIIAGNLKQYPDTPNPNNNFGFNTQMQNIVVRDIFHSPTVQRISPATEQPSTLPQTGLKLVVSESVESNQLVSREKKKARSDYWGQADISSPSSESGSETEEQEDEPAVPAVVEERDDDDYEDEEVEPAQVDLGTQTYGPTRTRLSWLVDGLEHTLSRYQPQDNMHIYQQSNTQGCLNTLNGGVVLARSFSRLLKTALKLLLPLSDDTGLEEQYTALPCVLLSAATHTQLLRGVTDLIEPVLQWAANLLDMAENQLELGKRLNLAARYPHTLAPGDLYDSVQRQGRTEPVSRFSDYTNYLICLNAGEADNLLPVIDIQSYQHIAFLLDAHVYFAANWHKCCSLQTPVVTEQAANQALPPDANFFLRQSSLIVSKHKQQQQTEPDFKIPLRLDIPLAEKPHLLKPDTSSTTLFSMSATTPTSEPVSSRASVLSYSQLAAGSVTQLSSQELMSRWKNVIQAFVDVFISTGPAKETDNFLIVRAGFAGKKARFYSLLSSLNGNQGMFSCSSHLSINRSELLKDSLAKLFALAVDTRSQLDVSFEGEEGGGIGVTAGFYTAFANALKSDEKMPPKTQSLFYEPGKIPEQATFYAPNPSLLSKENPLLVQRLTYYRAIGKFFGLCLTCRQPIPLLLSRHVLKYLLERQISWHDVGFYNADLYEGLRRMIVHCQEEEMTHETFQSIYMLNFDVTVNDTQCELKPGGKSILVTPDNVQEYVRLYSMYLMVGSVKEELEEMKTGFKTVIPASLTQGLTAEDLQLLLSGGSTTVSYSKLKENARIGFNQSLPDSVKLNFTKNFFRLIRRMNNNQRQQLLYFGTGSALLAGGHMVLNISVGAVGGMEAPLPTAATCGRTIQMPCYRDYTVLKSKVMSAIVCDSYGFA